MGKQRTQGEQIRAAPCFSVLYPTTISHGENPQAFQKEPQKNIHSCSLTSEPHVSRPARGMPFLTSYCVNHPPTPAGRTKFRHRLTSTYASCQTEFRPRSGLACACLVLGGCGDAETRAASGGGADSNLWSS